MKAQFYIPESVWTTFDSYKEDATDPFTTPSRSFKPTKLPRSTPQERLEEAGIAFAEGAYARYDDKAEILTIVQTSEQMELVEAFLESIHVDFEKQILAVAEIYRVPALAALEVMESIRSHGDHTPERNAVLETVRSGKSELLTVPTILCRSGQRAKTSEILFEQPEIHADDEGDAPESRQIPLVEMETDIVLGADEYTVDANLQLTFRSDDRPEVERALAVQTTLHDGKWQLLGSWNVGENEMMLIFFSASVQSLGY